MKFGIGILGATGFIGTPYREEIRQSPQQASIVALCARRRDRLDVAAELDGAKVATQRWEDVVNHQDVNLVVVATPDSLHHQAVMACAAAGKHVFCEKPIGVNAREAEEMWNAFRDARLGHYVPFWTRYVPVMQRAREIVRAGRLGEIKAAIYRWHNPRPVAMPFTWRDDAQLSAAGSIADVGSHAYDAVRWILGEEACRVLAHAEVLTRDKPDLGEIDLTEALEWGQEHARSDSSATRQATAVDYANIIWQFPSGCVGSLILSHSPVLRKGFSPEVELHGTEASLSIDRIDHRLLMSGQGDEIMVEAELPFDGFGNRFGKYVFPAIQKRMVGEACDDPGLEDGWHNQRFTDAAVSSAQRGQWVEIEPLA